MTGKDLIIYILNKNLENEDIENILSRVFLTKERVAVEMGVGVETVKTMLKLGVLQGVEIGDEVYICSDYKQHLKGEYAKD